MSPSRNKANHQALINNENHRQQRYVGGIRLVFVSRVEKDVPMLAVQAGPRLVPYSVRMGNLLRCNAFARAFATLEMFRMWTSRVVLTCHHVCHGQNMIYEVYGHSFHDGNPLEIGKSEFRWMNPSDTKPWHMCVLTNFADHSIEAIDDEFLVFASLSIQKPRRFVLMLYNAIKCTKML